MFTKDGKVEAFGLHCKGVTSMARTAQATRTVRTASSFLCAQSSEHLDTQYSIWGNTVMGYDLLEKPKVGTIGEVPGWVPDRMLQVDMAK